MPSKIYPFDAFTPIGLPQPRTEHAQLTGRLRRPVNKSTSSAFTLIELLTVIAIIGILAAIIIPTVGKVRKTAQQSTCASNLRQLALAFLLYADDHKGSFPPAVGTEPEYNVKGTYPLHIRSYIGKPAIVGTPTADDKYGGDPTGKGVTMCPTLVSRIGYKSAQSYGVNRWLYADKAGGSQPLKRDMVIQATRTILLGDAVFDGANTGSTIGETIANAPGTTRGVTTTHREHTDGAANLVFCDGHVQFWKNSYDLAQTKYWNGSSTDLWTLNK